MSLVQLQKLGYCEICKKPFTKGQFVCELNAPDGTKDRVHASCLGPDFVPPTPDGGTPLAA